MSFSLGGIQYKLFLIFVFLIPFEHILLIFFGIDTFFKPYRIVGILIIIVTIIKFLINKKIKEVELQEGLMISFISIGLIVSIVQFLLGNLYLSFFINDFIQIVFLLLIYLSLSGKSINKSEYYTILNFFCLGVFFNSLSIFIEFNFIGEIARPKGFSDNPNTAAWQMAIASFYLLSRVLYDNGLVLRKIFYLSLSFFFFLSILPTGSRASLALLILLGVLIFALKSKSNRILLLVGFFTGVCAFIPSLNDVTSIRKQSSQKAAQERTALDRLTESGDYDPRYDLWRGGINAGLNTYLLGVGVGQFRKRGSEFVKNAEHPTVRAYLKRESGLGIHSNYIAIFAKFGIFGIIIYLLFILINIRDLIDIYVINRLNPIIIFKLVILFFLIVYGIASEDLLIPNYWISLIFINIKII